MEEVTKLAEIDQRAKSNTRRIEVLEATGALMHELNTNIALIAQKQSELDNSIEDLKADVKSLTSKPAKRWDSAIDHIVGVILGILIGYIFLKIGIK